jgi:paraquat-inducible protein B
MGSKANPTLIGAFMLGAVILIAASILIFSRATWFTKSQDFVLYFSSSVNGLNVGAPVKFEGVQIGEVTSIAAILRQKDFTSVNEVRIRIRPEALTVIPLKGERRAAQADPAYRRLPALIEHGLRASLQMQSVVTGLLYVELSFQPGTPVRLVGLRPDMREIPTVPSAMNQMLSNIQETIQRLGKLPLDQLLDELIGMVQEVRDLLRGLTLKQDLQKVAAILQEFQQLVASISAQVPALADKLGDTLDAVRPVLNEAKNLVRDVDRQVVPLSGSVQEALSAAHGALVQAKQSLARVEKAAVPTLTQADKALEGVSGVVAPDAVLIRDLDQVLGEIVGAARAIRELAEYLERHPEALLRGKR